MAGIPVTGNDINNLAGDIARSLLAISVRSQFLGQFLAGKSDAELEAAPYALSAEDVAALRAMAADAAQLNAIFAGAATLDAVKDFRVTLQPLAGLSAV